MNRLGLMLVLLLASCGSVRPVAGVTPASTPTLMPSPSASPTPSAEPAPSEEPSPVAEPTPTPALPSVSCAAGVVPAAIVMLSSFEAFGAHQYLYDVTDPVQPHLVCRIANTVARIDAGTSLVYVVPQPDGKTRLVRHALGTNMESTVATFPADVRNVDPDLPIDQIAWSPDLSRIVYAINRGDGNVFVRVADPKSDRALMNYTVPVRGTIGRPGLPPPVLAISPDGAFLAVGWAVERPIRVYRLLDRVGVATLNPAGLRFALWGTKDHTLYVIGSGGVQSWTPEAGAAPVQSAPPWTLAPNFSPAGTQVAFTSVDAKVNVKVHVYDLTTKSDRLLTAQPRSNAIFVKPNWVWYTEEKACVPSVNCIGDPTAPDGTILAMNLTTGGEIAVTFKPHESPVNQQNGFIYPWDVWPVG